MVKRALPHKILKQAKDKEGRMLLLDVEVRDTVYTIGSLYAPTQDKPHNQISFMDELETLLDTMTSSNVLLGGDFNCLLNPALDKNSTNLSPPTASPYRDRITEFLEDRMLCDLWRVRQPAARGYTFRRGSYMSRLDYVFISNHLSNITSQVKICHGPHSDHSLISLSLGKPQDQRSPGIWRFDTTLLADHTFTTQMSEFLAQWEAPPELLDPTVIWEWLKFRIKGRIIEYQGQKKSATALTIKTLRLQRQELHDKLSSDPGSSDSIETQLQSTSR